MTRVEPVQSGRDLRALLAQADGDPIQLVRRLEEARGALAQDATEQWELDRIEVGFLGREAARLPRAPALQAAVRAARLAELAVLGRMARSRPDDEAAALFDLTDLAGDSRFEGLSGEADALRAEVQRRAAAVPLGAALREEARERYAALATEEEELSLAHRICRLEECARMLRQLAARGADPEFERLARRMERQACDRRLQQRLARALTPRGAVALELFSLTLLLVVCVLIALEATFEWSDATLQAFRVVDASICAFFIVEFLFKLALAPARLSWFARNALTDLLPAIPAAMLFAPTFVPEGAGDVIWVRVLRFLRITYFARYFQALQPLLRLLRLVLFLVKGLDGLVRRFSPLLNRDFVFFEQGAEAGAEAAEPGRRELLFRAQRREHVLIAAVPADARGGVLTERARAVSDRLSRATPAERPRRRSNVTRDVPVEAAIAQLHALRPDELAQLMPRQDVAALDRVVGVVSTPVVRWLPLLRPLALRRPLPPTPEERVVAFARRIAEYLDRWRARLTWWADVHGIVTGPQVIDRIATAMVKTSQRPAVRLILFGLLFWLVRLLMGERSLPGRVLERFVATPLVVLGSICAVVLALGWWLKKIAGEASEAFKLTSEVSYISLLETCKTRRERQDAEFLARRLFRFEVGHEAAAHAIEAIVDSTRGWPPRGPLDIPQVLQEETNQAALLYLHFLDGALLHASDIKTTEQLLANQSLENVRTAYLGWGRRERRRLRKLSLAEGSLFGGPYMWFSFITESAAVEAAKRITEYNRHCLTLEQRAQDPPAARALAAWLELRRAEVEGREPGRRVAPPRGAVFRTTEFCALDFLAALPDRDAHVERVFGADVLDLLRADRQHMVREIFGMRPLHRLPRSRRSFNAYGAYQARLSRGRVILLPLFVGFACLRLFARAMRRTAGIVREILAPHLAAQPRARGRAPFAVALRKINRMKAPGLLEAMRMRVEFDPAYSGSPTTWSDGFGFEEKSELERDLDFLRLPQRARAPLRALAERSRTRMEVWQATVPRLPQMPTPAGVLQRRLCEQAATIAYATDHERIRTLLAVEGFLHEDLPRLAGRRGLARPLPVRLAAWLLRRGRRHVVDVVIARHWSALALSRRARTNLRGAFDRRAGVVRDVVLAMAQLEPGTDPSAEAARRLAAVYRGESTTNRELTAVRAVQSLTVLDIRNYRELVFRLGGYEQEGEDPAAASALP
jgi:hypothetical protein